MLFIGIAGGTGCGKTTVVNQISGVRPESEGGMMSQDAYYNDLSHLSYAERAESRREIGETRFDATAAPIGLRISKIQTVGACIL